MHLIIVYDSSGKIYGVANNRSLNRSEMRPFESSHKVAVVTRGPKELDKLSSLDVVNDFRVKSVIKDGMVEIERAKKTR